MKDESLHGGCACGYVRFVMRGPPMMVHCCHCTWCQRETGTGFALNALIERDRVECLKGEVEVVDTPTASGDGQLIARCPRCRVAVWSQYALGRIRDLVYFVRVGALDTPSAVPPDIHIFTSTKLPWVILDDGVPVFEEYYRADEVWSAESLRRRQALKDSLTT
ncbi:MAG: GFA family protein [Myxococcota bacterium]